MKKLLIAALIIILGTGCSNVVTRHKEEFRIEPIINQEHKLSPFKSVVLSGNSTVELVNGMYAVQLTGLEKQLQQCRVDVVAKELHIYVKSPAVAKLIAPEINRIVVADKIVLNSKHFKTNNLTIIAKDGGAINLDGFFNIDGIYQHSHSGINISWVSSDKLLIDSDSDGSIYLAGIANNMVAKLTHAAQLDAQYLRAKKASIFATDRARAEVLPLNTLEAFAIDNSSIYYYKRPHVLTIVTREHGNVLYPSLLHQW